MKFKEIRQRNEKSKNKEYLFQIIQEEWRRIMPETKKNILLCYAKLFRVF